MIALNLLTTVVLGENLPPLPAAVDACKQTPTGLPTAAAPPCPPVMVVPLHRPTATETFEKIQDTEAWSLTPQHLEDFVELWAHYDDGA